MPGYDILVGIILAGEKSQPMNKTRKPISRMKVWVANPYISIEESRDFEKTSELIERLGIDGLLVKESVKELKELKDVIDNQKLTDIHTELRKHLKDEGFNVLEPEEDGLITFEMFKRAIEKGQKKAEERLAL